MTKNVLSDNSQSCRLDSNVYSAMFNYQYPPTSRKHALKLQTSQVLHVENKKIIKKQLGSLKKQTLILTLPKKNQKIQSFFKFSFTVIVSIK